MTPENFCHWLNGFVQISGASAPTAQHWKIINDHLDLVFNKVTPNYNVDKDSGAISPIRETNLGSTVTAPRKTMIVNPLLSVSNHPMTFITCLSSPAVLQIGVSC